MSAQVERWIPDYAKHDYTLHQAEEIAQACEETQERAPSREWTDILTECVREYDEMVASQIERSDPTPLPGMTATYSPDDNKLRLYSTSRLDRELYDRVRAAGFSWAPKQELFVAPSWTPEREDLLLELCGEIDDEDKSLVDRAEERADRFEDYSDKREADAGRAHEAVHAVSQRFEFGQPILVGHHSEKRARKDAERIENGMRRAVKLWETSKYWESRAKGALHHAKYKELPGVRHRRIKGLEADKRKREKTREQAVDFMKLWVTDGLTAQRALSLANYEIISTFPERVFASVWGALEKNELTPEAARDIAVKTHTRMIASSDRWISHLDNRLAYERAMLDDGGGLAADKFAIEVGGKVLTRRWRRDEWLTVLRVNRASGRINSVTTNAKVCRVLAIEEVTDYRPPEEGAAAKVKAAKKLPPLVNFPMPGGQTMTRAEWDRKPTDYGRTCVAPATAEHGAYRYRESWVGGGSFKTAPVFISDAKRVDPPPPETTERPELDAPEPVLSAEPRAPRPKPEPTVFDAMKESLKAGVLVVSAPQLFPTPPELAERMVKLARIQPGHSILEPSAGTGNIVRAILDRTHEIVAEYARFGTLPEENTLTAIEINAELAKIGKYRCADFISCEGTFDRIIMNPPFSDGQDIAHILHAKDLLKPGGLLVALCANGPRQNEKLRSIVDTWEELPEGSFKEAGTNVRVALLTWRKP